MADSSVVNYEGNTMQLNDAPHTDQNVFLSRNTTDNVFEVQDHALIESLSRDILLASGEWTTDDPEISETLTLEQLQTEYNQPFLASVSLPDDIVRGSSFISSKLANIAYMRCDYELTVRMQSTPFLQGAVWFWNKMNAQQTSVLRRTLTEHLRSITSFPGIELNLQSESRAISLSVPYTSEFEVFNPRNTNNLNSIRLSVLSKLAGPETNVKVSYSIFGRLKNIKLYGHAPSVTSLSFPQTEAGTDESASAKGIVSQVADTVGSVANVVEGLGVPILSTIAKPVSWVSNVVGNVASVFGFSKDRDLTKVTTYENLPAKGFTHGVGIDSSVPLSLFPNNAINPTLAIPENLDEMSIEYLAQRPYVLRRYTIQGGDTPSPAKTVIADIPISPVNYSLYGAIVKDYRTIFGAPISLAAALSNWWRGQIKLNVRFAKTQFHQCRLLVQYLPYGDGVEPLENVLSTVIDVSSVDDKGIDISFPSVYKNKWMRVYDSAIQGYTAGAAPGRIVISVLNPLNSAATVSDSIIMYAWVTWEGFETAELGSLAKAAIGFDYPPDLPAQPLYSSVRLPPSGSVFTLLQDTVASIGSSADLTSLRFTNLTTGDPIDVVTTNFPDKINGLKQVSLSQGEYRVNYESPTSVFVITNRPINSDPIGPGFHVTGNLANATSFTISESTQVSVGTTDVILANSAIVAVTGDSGSINLATLSTNGFDIPTAVILEAGTYELSLTNLDSVSLVSTKPLTIPPSSLSIPSTHSGLDYTIGDNSNMLTTMGEQYRSLRMFTRRFSPVDILKGVNVTLPGINLGTDNSLRQSLLNVISYMYRFTHGSIAYKIVPLIKGDLLVTTISEDTLELNPNANRFDTNRALHYLNTNLNPIAQIVLPFYSPAENLVLDSNSFPQLSDLSISNLDGGENTYFILAGAGDDHTFSQLAGCPAFTFGPSRSA
ncbi:hypothetical protein 2 [Wenzhou shrimp virus 7]|uniref:hypothetical protein 2 n=1 Tax=Wenzhou shrimp virus 7 TaxID=1923654 RepID=UPI00090C8198|nr:hypothetical protein 2 [Wenzhou shrimp virus 7]APG76674.1 hypothetical protein 2 [Wenzhou shrimp virus 7]APG78544.1 hypothetical protein 2 [Wenzhou shrimp virus 7]